jgi:hypothetical protein
MPVPSLDPEFLDMMTARVTYAAWTGQDGYGQRTYGTARTYAAHLTQDPTVMTNLSGEDIRAQAIVWMSPTAVAPDGTFLYNDLIAAQGGFPTAPPLGDVLSNGKLTFPDGTATPIRTASILQDDVGWHHIKFLF